MLGKLDKAALIMSNYISSINKKYNIFPRNFVMRATAL